MGSSWPAGRRCSHSPLRPPEPPGGRGLSWAELDLTRLNRTRTRMHEPAGVGGVNLIWPPVANSRPTLRARLGVAQFRRAKASATSRGGGSDARSANSSCSANERRRLELSGKAFNLSPPSIGRQVVKRPTLLAPSRCTRQAGRPAAPRAAAKSAASKRRAGRERRSSLELAARWPPPRANKQRPAIGARRPDYSARDNGAECGRGQLRRRPAWRDKRGRHSLAAASELICAAHRPASARRVRPSGALIKIEKCPPPEPLVGAPAQVGSLQLAVCSLQLAVGSWQLAATYRRPMVVTPMM